MTPLTKEEIDELAAHHYIASGCFVTLDYKRLFYTARRGAEFVLAQEHGKESA